MLQVPDQILAMEIIEVVSGGRALIRLFHGILVVAELLGHVLQLIPNRDPARLDGPQEGKVRRDEPADRLLKSEDTRLEPLEQEDTDQAVEAGSRSSQVSPNP
jgi:hypothetical protein